MRERCWFIPEQVLKGKLPYRDVEDPVHVSRPISVGRIGSFSTGASHVWNEPNASSEFGSDASNQMV
jgi:hypothetical protein